MSHFSRIKTQMVEKRYLSQALNDLGYACEEGDVEVRGYGGKRTPVELRFATRNPGYDIGFNKVGGAYDMVADWWGIADISQEQFLRQITQRYAYNATREKLEQQGFSIVNEERQKEGQIHLTLRRMV